jgi:uncharacterized protein YuzE
MKKIAYDPESKILTIRFKDTKSVDSDIIENLVLDYDTNGKLVKVDVMETDFESFLQLENESTAVAA